MSAIQGLYPSGSAPQLSVQRAAGKLSGECSAVLDCYGTRLHNGNLTVAVTARAECHRWSVYRPQVSVQQSACTTAASVSLCLHFCMPCDLPFVDPWWLSDQSAATRSASTESSVWTLRVRAWVSAVPTVPSLPTDARRMLGVGATRLCHVVDMAHVTWGRGPAPASEAM